MPTELQIHAELATTELTLDPKPTAYFGRGKVTETGAIVSGLGARSAMIVTDPFLGSSPVVDAVRRSLESAGVSVAVFDGVTPNPTTTCVDAGADMAQTAAVDVLVPVGGGSSMDAAKGISLGAVNPARGARLDYSNDFPHPALPIVAVPTTAGTGAEVNAFGVVTDVEAHRKFYVGHATALPKAAVLDPELTLGLPPKATAATGMDALTHAIESYSSIRQNPYSDGIALQVISMVAEFLPRAVTDGTDIEARSQMLLASHIAGVGFSHTGLGLVHAIAHPLGGRFNIPHGLALCLIIEDVLRLNLRTRLDRTARIAFALGVGNTAASAADNAESAITAVAQLARQVGMTARLNDFGITAADLDSLVQDSLDDEVINNTPVPPTTEEIRTILENAL
jgi:alcohol dehydrogenase